MCVCVFVIPLNANGKVFCTCMDAAPCKTAITHDYLPTFTFSMLSLIFFITNQKAKD